MFVLKLLKWVFYLVVAGFIALTAYAYIGPFFGADFSPRVTEIQQDITIEAQ